MVWARLRIRWSKRSGARFRGDLCHKHVFLSNWLHLCTGCVRRERRELKKQNLADEKEVFEEVFIKNSRAGWDVVFANGLAKSCAKDKQVDTGYGMALMIEWLGLSMVRMRSIVIIGGNYRCCIRYS